MDPNSLIGATTTAPAPTLRCSGAGTESKTPLLWLRDERCGVSAEGGESLK